MARTNYQRGRDFEYRVRDALKKEGAVYVMRAAGSHTIADLAAFFPHRMDAPTIGRTMVDLRHPYVWLVQAKRDGRLPADERKELIRVGRNTATVPVLAKAGDKGRGVIFEILKEE